MRYLPVIEPQGAEEPVALFGARIVRWLLAEGCTVTLTNEQIELAEYAACYASTTQGYLLVTYERISALRHELAACTARRKAQQASGATILEPLEPRIDGNSMARLVPVVPHLPGDGDVLPEPNRQYDRIAF